MIDTSYFNQPSTPVKDFNDYVSSGLPEIPKLKSLVTQIKSVFKSQDSALQLYLIEGRVYRVDIFKSSRKKDLVGSVYYVTASNQVHIWDNNSNLLLASSKKRVIHSNIPYILDYVGATDKFRNIIQSV